MSGTDQQYYCRQKCNLDPVPMNAMLLLRERQVHQRCQLLWKPGAREEQTGKYELISFCLNGNLKYKRYLITVELSRFLKILRRALPKKKCQFHFES